MIWKKLKITVEQPFQRDWLGKGIKQILDEPQNDFPLKTDNYITNRAELSQNQCQFILGQSQHPKKLLQVSFDMGFTTMLRTTYKKCKRCRRQSSLPPNIKYEMHSVSLSPHAKKQVGLDLCSLPEVNGYRHLIVCNDYSTKRLEANPIREKTALTAATFLFKLTCRHSCFKVQVNCQGREFVNETSFIFYAFWQTDRG